jgi:transposase
MAYLRGEPKVWSVVQVPSVTEEDDRRLHRERDRRINERIQHVNRIKGLCARCGWRESNPHSHSETNFESGAGSNFRSGLN